MNRVQGESILFNPCLILFNPSVALFPTEVNRVQPTADLLRAAGRRSQPPARRVTSPALVISDATGPLSCVFNQ
jgi:hypothetical protein